jgi:GNAT superfamily N-acetyltransferase
VDLGFNTYVTGLRIEPVDHEDSLKDWLHVHNTVVPTHHLTLDEVRERAGRNRLEVAYVGDVLVGCSTVRPPTDGTATATVIARVLGPYRRRGFGEALYERALRCARGLGAEVIETVVLESNPDGLRFAHRHGFVEVERYLLPGETVHWIDLRLATPPFG